MGGTSLATSNATTLCASINPLTIKLLSELLLFNIRQER